MSIEIPPNFGAICHVEAEKLVNSGEEFSDIPGFSGFIVSVNPSPDELIKLGEIEIDGKIVFVCQKK